MKIGILGGGQLAYMLCENILNIIEKIYIFSDKNDIPCEFLKNNNIEIIYGDYKLNNLINFSEKCDIITYEFENIDIELLKNISRLGKKIYPKIEYLEIIQDKLIQKEYLKKNNLKVGPFSELNNLNDIYNFIDNHKYPILLKARKGSFDGRGNNLIKDKNELEIWLSLNKDFIKNYYIENFINFTNELSICGCQNKGIIYSYEPVKNIHKNSVLLKTEFKKKGICDEIINKSKKTYHKILEIFNTKGVICSEFFEFDKEIYINEIALRVHNTYHISLDCCNISQFELHLRSILDLEIPKLCFTKEGYMFNLISNLQTEKEIEKLYEKMKINYLIKKKMYNKKPLGIRKIGHINFIKLD